MKLRKDGKILDGGQKKQKKTAVNKTSANKTGGDRQRRFV